LKSSIEYEEEQKIDLVHGLSKLFSEIGASEGEQMKWKEFTQYIMEIVMQDTIDNNTKNQKERIAEAHSKTYTRFSLSSYTDSTIYKGVIQKVEYYPTLNRLLVIEHKSRNINFVTPELKNKERLNVIEEEDIKKNDKYFILSFAFDEVKEAV